MTASRYQERVFPALSLWRTWRLGLHLFPGSTTVLGRLRHEGDAAFIRGQGLMLDQAGPEVEAVEQALGDMPDLQVRCIESKWLYRTKDDIRARKCGFASRTAYLAELDRGYAFLDGYIRAAEVRRIERGQADEDCA